MTDGPKQYQRFLAELKRRRVFKVAAVYGGVSFVLLQAADLMVEGLNLPQLVLTMVTAVALFGFPLALALAWAFDLTSEGVKRADPAASGELEAIVAQPAARRWPAGILALVGTALLIGGVWWTLARGGNATGEFGAVGDPAAASIAVLPFVNMSGDEENEYFSDGITEELLTALTRVPNLKVAARTSTFAFKGTDADVRTIAQQLEVATILEGSVRKSGDQVRITAQLINAEDGFHLWSDTYDRRLDDIFAIQDEIARSIVDALKVTLQGDADADLTRSSTNNAEAYNDYLRGRHFWNRRTLAAFDSAIQHFNRAVLLDPGYARAYAALAEAYVLLPEYGGPPMSEVLPYATAATERALALDPDLAEAHVASAYRKMVFEWDWDGAERDYLKAIELNPDYPTAHHWYAEMLAAERRWDESLSQIQRAVELDPLAPAPNTVLGLILGIHGRYEEAIAAVERALGVTPNMLTGIWALTVISVAQGDYATAGSAFDRLADITGTDSAAYRAYIAALSDTAMTAAAVTALQSSAVFGTVGPAEYLAQLGRIEETLAALEAGFEARFPYLHWTNTLPQYEDMRSDPRFLAFIEKLNLE
jgi:serine/threonine-protein kinase